MQGRAVTELEEGRARKSELHSIKTMFKSTKHVQGRDTSPWSRTHLSNNVMDVGSGSNIAVGLKRLCIQLNNYSRFLKQSTDDQKGEPFCTHNERGTCGPCWTCCPLVPSEVTASRAHRWFGMW